jgi:hypothetical protein
MRRSAGWRWRPSVALLLACSACATAEDVEDGPVRPSQYGGASGAGASGGALGTGGVSASGGSGGALGSSGNGGAGGTFGTSGATGASGAGTNGASGSSGNAGSSGSAGRAGSGGASGSAGSAGSSGSAGANGASGASGTPGAQLFFDDFEANADKWQALPAEGWSIVTDGTKVYQQGTLDTQARFSAAGNSAWTDQVVEAKVKVLAFTGSSSSYQAAVYARFTPDAHYYVALQSNGDFKIKKFSGGNNTSISSAASVDVAVNTWYTVKLEVIGTALKAYLNGTAVLNATDADVTAGGIAVGTKNATAAFDDVKVTAP